MHLVDRHRRVERIGRKSLTLAFEFRKGDELLARGHISSVFCRIGAGHKVESMEIPSFVRERLERGSSEEIR